VETEQAVDEIIELVYHSAVVSDDNWVQERCTRASVFDILEEYRNSKTGNEEDLSVELRQAGVEIDDLKDRIAELETENEVLVRRIAQEELAIK